MPAKLAKGITELAIDEVLQGYLNREHPFALYWGDRFGKTVDWQDYFAETPETSAAESTTKKEMIAHLKRQLATQLKLHMGSPADKRYEKCPITSGFDACDLIAERNERANFDPKESITTTDKIERHIGSALKKELVTEPNNAKSLTRASISAAKNPDEVVVAPAMKESVLHAMFANPDAVNFSMQAEAFMATWFPVIDLVCNRDSNDGAPDYSRNTLHEGDRAIKIMAGLHPIRPEADTQIVDLDNTQIPVIQRVKDVYEVARYQVGIGMHPSEAAQSLAEWDMIFDHLKGKKNAISEAREAAGAKPFPEHIAPQMQEFITRDEDEYKALRKEIKDFLKKYCLHAMDRTNLDPEYEEWYQDGFGRAPAYTDGMHHYLRQDLGLVERDVIDLQQLIRDHAPHEDNIDASGLAANRVRISDMTERLLSTFNRIDEHLVKRPEDEVKLGHWKPALNALKSEIERMVESGTLLKTASPSNHERITTLVQNIQTSAEATRKRTLSMLDDKTILALREEARQIGLKVKTGAEFKQKSMSGVEPPMGLKRFIEGKRPFDGRSRPPFFDDRLFDKNTDRVQAELPQIVAGTSVFQLPQSKPHTIHISVDPKTLPSALDTARAPEVSGVKNTFGVVGMDSDQFTDATKEYCAKAEEHFKAANPGTTVYSSRQNWEIYDLIAKTPEATAKKGGGYRWDTNAQLNAELEEIFEHTTVLAQAPGWWASEKEVQKRVYATQIQLGVIDRPQGSNLSLYTLPEDPNQIPANIEPDSLYDSILPIAKFVKDEFESGRKVPPQISLGLMRLLETHAMLKSPDVMKKRLPAANQQFGAHSAHPSVVSYLTDARVEALGGLARGRDDVAEAGIYEYFMNPRSGLLAEPAIIRHIPEDALNDSALGDKPKDMQRRAQGKRSLGITERPGEEKLYIDAGMHV